MGNKIARVVIGIVVACAVLVGVYFILPGSVKNPITAWLQNTTDDNYIVVVTALQNAKVPKHKKVSYQQMMESATENSAWTIEKVNVNDAGDGSYLVYADGYKCTVAMENEVADNMITQSNAHVRIVFSIEKQGSTIKINNKELKDGKAADPSEVIVAEYDYKASEKSPYIQKALDSMTKGLD